MKAFLQQLLNKIFTSVLDNDLDPSNLDWATIILEYCGALQFSSLPYSNPSRSTSFSHLPSPTSTTTKHQNLLRRRLSPDHRVNSPVRRRRLPGLGPPTLLPAIRLLRRLRRTQGLRHRFPNLPRLRRRRLFRHSAGVGGLLFSVDLRLIERPGLLSDRGLDVSFMHDFESNTAADGYVKRLEY
ncbi:hypothetical protein DVH24_004368 [Malus domestica]|uniref:Uncharacterized protein n=1 Tax=Malus domestica TaxID=3750 RepID=A0A498IEA4_MALDO|nr:hypothetical protein DVH24_004368 [Malus domestica]